MTTFDLDPEALRHIHDMLDSISARVDEIREAIVDVSTPSNNVTIKSLTADRVSLNELKVTYELTGSTSDLGRIGTIIANDPPSWIEWLPALTGTQVLRLNKPEGGAVLIHVWSNAKNDFIIGHADFPEWQEPATPSHGLAFLSDAEKLAKRRPPGLPLDALGNAIEPEVRHVGEQGAVIMSLDEIQSLMPGPTSPLADH